MSNSDQQNEITEISESAKSNYSQKWNSENAGKILQQWRNSGMSMKSFSQENGIGYHRLILNSRVIVTRLEV